MKPYDTEEKPLSTWYFPGSCSVNARERLKERRAIKRYQRGRARAFERRLVAREKEEAVSHETLRDRGQVSHLLVPVPPLVFQGRQKRA